MIVVIGELIPDRIRGVLQIWLLEVRPNVFVGDITQVVEKRILKFLNSYMSTKTDLMIIRSSNSGQGFSIEYPYNKKDKLVNMSGLQLIQKSLEAP